MRGRFVQLAILMIILISTSEAWATTYYIDWVNGADTNDGITKSTPWKSAPGMYSCTSNCLTKQKAGGKPGDQFILKGGVTWPRAALSWDWYFGSGTQTSPIYFGADQTWYSGNSWSRPVLNAEAGTPNASPENVKAMMRVYGTWIIVDNLEFTGLAQLSNDEPRMLIAGTSSASAIEIRNCYFHGWSHAEIATFDKLMCISTALIKEGSDMNTKIHHNVFDGSDTSADMGMAYKGSAGHFYNNYISKLANGVLGNPKYLWGNTFKDVGHANFDTTAHMNSIETLGGESVIYNNFFDNTSGGVTIWTENQDGDTDYIFNNVVIRDSNQGLQISNWSYVTGNNTGIHVFNNTFHGQESASGQRVSGPSYTSKPYMSFLNAKNNHLIGKAPTVVFNRTITQVESNNLGMSITEAASAGYTETAMSPLSPPPGGPTVGAGADLRSLAAAIPSSAISDAATAVLSDTTCGVRYDPTKHEVVGPNRTSVVRGSRWDIGAYQYTDTASQPTPPQNLKALP